jgi:ribosomal protein L32
MSKVSKKKKEMRRGFAIIRMSMPCPNCGLQGPHFAPPSLGEPGFYICQKPS